MRKIQIISTLLLTIIIFASPGIHAQTEHANYEDPKEYEIGGITVSGIQYYNQEAIIQLSGLQIGKTIKIPGEDISNAIRNLWDRNLWSDVKITLTNTEGNVAFLNIELSERPRLSKYAFRGISSGDADDLREELHIKRGDQVTENMLIKAKNTIRNFMIDDGYRDADVSVVQKEDSLLPNHLILYFVVKPGEDMKIEEITFEGNTVFSDRKLRWTMDETLEKCWYCVWTIFTRSKLVRKNFDQDLQLIIDKYREEGYRDARIVKDSIWDVDEDLMSIKVWIDEGKQYYFGDVSWVGNTIYPSYVLDKVLGIEKGEVFDQSLLDDKLLIAENSVSSLYLDNGYLFFNVQTIETATDQDTIDLEMRVYEGKQAYINKVTISGNDKTKDYIFRRELHTVPGKLFSRSDIIRSQRELSQLPYVNPEGMNVLPTPNPEDGSVDIEYVIEEKASDQIELSGGYGAGMLIGTLGLSINNFSTKDFFKSEAWNPLPTGDGQRLSMRVQSSGWFYQGYNVSFMEPWLGGKKPNAFSVSAYHSAMGDLRERSGTDGYYMKITGISLGLGQRLKWPDDYFMIFNQISYQVYNLKNYTYYDFLFSNGRANNISFTTNVSRNSIDQPIYPRRGSNYSLTLQLTPPYSLFSDADYSTMEDEKKYKWIEYHKWTLETEWYNRIVGDLVLKTSAEFGFLSYYNKDWGYSPFEGFVMTNDPLSGYRMYGADFVMMRGYDRGFLDGVHGINQYQSNAYDKFTAELRYPLSLNPMATFYLLTFMEGGYYWYDVSEFDPFRLYKSAGLGIRMFMPMFGMMGVDFGYGMDAENPQFMPTIIIGQQF